MQQSAEFIRGALWLAKLDGKTLTAEKLQQDLAAAEAREAGESDSIKLAKLIDGMFYCEGGGYDSDDVREGIQQAFEIGVQSAGKTETSETGKRDYLGEARQAAIELANKLAQQEIAAAEVIAAVERALKRVVGLDYMGDPDVAIQSFPNLKVTPMQAAEELYEQRSVIDRWTEANGGKP